MINLGTNDMSHRVSSSQFNQNSVARLQRGSPGPFQRSDRRDGHLQELVRVRDRNAVATRNAAGHSKVPLVDTAGWIGSADTIDGTPPSMAGHANVVRRLIPIVDQYI